MGVIEAKEGNKEQARSSFAIAREHAPLLHDAFYNGGCILVHFFFNIAAIVAYKLGDFQESYQLVRRALELFPDHQDSKELLHLLDDHFAGL